MKLHTGKTFAALTAAAGLYLIGLGGDSWSSL